MRRLLLAVLVTVLGLTPVVVVAAPPSALAGMYDDCDTNSDDPRVPLRAERRCINKRDLRTRSTLKIEHCLDGTEPQDGVYKDAKFCGGGGPEFIAQARAIAHLNNSYPPGGPLVSADLQWEVTVPEPDEKRKSGRVDILYYNRLESDPIVHVYEAKVAGYMSQEDTLGQADGYIGSLTNKLGMKNVIRGTALTIAYYDYFWVKATETDEECDGGTKPERLFEVTVPEPGLLWVKETKHRCQNGISNPIFPNLTGEEEETEEFPGPHQGPFCPLYCSGSASGDPHLATIDGLKYDFQAAGEFTFAASDQYGLQVQTRFVPAPGASWSALERAAVEVNEHTVEFRRDGSMLLDSAPYPLAQGATLDLQDHARVVRTVESGRDRYYVIWNGSGHRPVLTFTPGRIAANIGLYVPADPDNDLYGLVGNADGDPMNDLRLSDGTQLPATAPASTLHGTFADSWRINDEDSLFAYESGESTATFTNKAFPSNITTIHDLTPEQILAATEVCTAHQVPAGPQFDNCILDVTLTTDDDLAALASLIKKVPIDPHAATPNSNGDLGVDFEAASLPANVKPARLASDGATSTFAGPFIANNTYRLYTQTPAHLNGTLTFDMLAIGDWNSDPDGEKLTVQIDRTEVWSQTFAAGTVTPTRSGVLGTGQPFTVYTATIPFTHSTDQIEVIFSATGVDSTATQDLANQAFGIDNVALHLDVVPPQTFDVALPFTASDGVPGTGAGNLETKVSRDDYRFTVTAGQGLYVDVQACPDAGLALNWKLVNDTTATPVAGGGCYDKQLTGLPAGTYRLQVTPAKDRTGTYTIEVFTVAAPQEFTVTLPATISNGVPGAGAGNLETKASRDVYRFTAAAGQNLNVDVQACPGGGAALNWRVVDDATEAEVGNGGCYDNQLTGLPAGTYRLIVAPGSERTGTYTIEVTAITAPQTFDVALPFTISDGVPAAGAGNLETKTSQDEYRFTAAAGQDIYVDVQACPGGGLALNWKLVNETTGATIGSAGCYDKQFTNLPAGTYRLVVAPGSERTGTYTIDVFVVPAAQVFDVTLPTTISDGVPGSGAGNLETKASQDEYRFTVTAGQNVLVDVQACPGGGLALNWKLVNETTGATIGSAGCYDKQFTNLPAGTYRLVVATSKERTGTYKINVKPV